MKKTHLGFSLVFISVLLSSVTPVLNKFALQSVNSSTASLWNALFSLSIAAVFLLAQHRKFVLVALDRLLLIAGLHAAGLFLMFYSLTALEPTTISILGRFYVVFAVLLGAVILKDKLNVKDYFIFAIAILGSFLFVNRDAQHAVSGVGVLAALSYTFLFALENLLCKKLVHNCSVFLISFFVNGFSMLLIFLYAGIQSGLHSGPRENFQAGFQNIFLAPFSQPIPPLTTLLQIALGALASILALNLGLTALRHIDFSRANALRALGPLATMGISAFFFPVHLTAINWLGGGLVIASFVVIPFLAPPFRFRGGFTFSKWRRR